MHEISWDHYRTFLAVIQSGSLSGAARDLGLTQPTVGRHVEALESALGHPLFTRSQLGLKPTETALALRPYAETMASTAAAVARHSEAGPDDTYGRVRISASDVMGIEVLPPIFASLQRQHPGLSVELSLSDALEDLIRREVDIAVRMTRPSQEALLAQKVGEVTLGLFARLDYLERYGAPKKGEDLVNHRMIGFDRRTAFIRAAEDRIRQLAPSFPAIETIQWSFRTDSNVAQLAAIRSGAGIGICQTPLGRRDPDLRQVLPEVFAVPLEIWVVMHENLRNAPRWRVAFDALVHGLRTYLAEDRQGKV